MQSSDYHIDWSPIQASTRYVFLSAVILCHFPTQVSKLSKIFKMEPTSSLLNSASTKSSMKTIESREQNDKSKKEDPSSLLHFLHDTSSNSYTTNSAMRRSVIGYLSVLTQTRHSATANTYVNCRAFDNILIWNHVRRTGVLNSRKTRERQILQTTRTSQERSKSTNNESDIKLIYAHRKLRALYTWRTYVKSYDLISSEMTICDLSWRWSLRRSTLQTLQKMISVNGWFQSNDLP